MDAIVWRMTHFYKEARPDTDTQARVARSYNLGFAILATERLLRLLKWKARRRRLFGGKTTIKVIEVPPAVSDIRQAETPEDLVRRQRKREEE